MWPFKKKDPLFRVVVYLKSGVSITVICKSCKVRYEGAQLTSYTFDDIKSGQVMFLCITDISAIISEPYRGRFAS